MQSISRVAGCTGAYGSGSCARAVSPTSSAGIAISNRMSLNHTFAIGAQSLLVDCVGRAGILGGLAESRRLTPEPLSLCKRVRDVGSRFRECHPTHVFRGAVQHRSLSLAADPLRT